MTDVEGTDARPLDGLGPDALLRLLGRTRDAFAAHRDEIDALNVFPVPDGDTGTNLLLTVDGVLEEVAQGSDDLPSAVARGALRSARGNSGVIFSQVLRALAEGVSRRGSLGADGLAEAFARARGYAYDAVADPVEGTMLTAVTVAADTARRTTGDGLVHLVRQVAEAVGTAVQRTTDQLEVLRDAGVVDAGARGMEVFCRELHGLAAGTAPRHVPAPVVRRRGAVTAGREAGSEAYQYEVQYLLEAPEAAAAPLRDQLGELGDSVVVVAAGGLMNVHVHTNEIGGAIEAGVEHGRPSRIQVVRFVDQVAEQDRGDDSPVADLGAVAVVPGAGLARVVEDMGGVPIAGGPGELPSVAELLNAVGTVHARRVAILPGHPNVVPAAHQAVEVAVAEGGRPLDVLERVDSIPGVLAALAVLAPNADPERTLDEMQLAATACRHGEVVPAIRDADTPIGPVRQGQHLALCGGDVLGASDDPLEALRLTAVGCAVADAELATLVTGAEVGETERARARDLLAELAPGIEIEEVDGGQTSARYVLGLE